MKYLDEFRQAAPARELLRQIHEQVGDREMRVMEVCGGQTHSILRHGLDQLLPPGLELLHGPGCPVCVTPLQTIDRALALAARPEVIFCSFGDMLRVPGSREDLFQVRGRGGDVRVVYSPLDAVQLARENPGREVVFFGVGFETTAPAVAMAALQARREKLSNFSMLVSHVRVPPALEAILTAPGQRVQGFLAAGHVCSVMGTREYAPLVERHGVPIVVAGFEPIDLLRALLALVTQLRDGQTRLENAYERAVRAEGNPSARRVLEEVFVTTDRDWRGIGVLPQSGWKLGPDYEPWDAELLFPREPGPSCASALCRAGEVLQGQIKPFQCSAFGRECTPERPLGAPMVSAEGACAAYFERVDR